MIKLVRKHLFWKIFLSYLFVILIGIGVMAAAADITSANSFERHLGMMNAMMQGIPQGKGAGAQGAGIELYRNYRTSILEAFTLSSIAAFIAALATSALMSSRFVKPIQAMTEASRHIANGYYHERVALKDNIEDSDELGQLAHSFNQMAEKLEQTETMRRQLLGDVTHELRTPLTTIKGSMEGLIDGMLQPEPEVFQRIYHETSRLERLVDDIQELSRIEAGAYQLNLTEIDAVGAINKAVQFLQPQYDLKAVSLNFKPEYTNIYVNADPDRLSQVLVNMLGNALQYTNPGGHVDVSVSNSLSEVVFKISDSGIGIPPEQLDMIFTRFYRVEKSRSRSRGGSGIGLTVTKSLVEAMGGRIWAYSSGINQGSTFSFTLLPTKSKTSA